MKYFTIVFQVNSSNITDPIFLVLAGENEHFFRTFSFIASSVSSNIATVRCIPDNLKDLTFSSELKKVLFLLEEGEKANEVFPKSKLLRSSRVVVVSKRPQLNHLKTYLNFNVTGIYSLQSAIKDFDIIMKQAFSRTFFLCPEYTSILFSSLRNSTQEVNISNREKQVLKLLCEGQTYVEISRTLNLSYETVKKHVSNLYSKLEVNSKGQAINKAMKMDLHYCD